MMEMDICLHLQVVYVCAIFDSQRVTKKIPNFPAIHTVGMMGPVLMKKFQKAMYYWANYYNSGT